MDSFLPESRFFFSLFNSAPKTSNVSWMDIKLLTIGKVSKHKLGPFKHAQSLSKQPAGLVYVVNFINYLPYLPAPLPRGLEVDLEGSCTFPTLMLLIYILIDKASQVTCKDVYSTMLPCGRVSRLAL